MRFLWTFIWSFLIGVMLVYVNAAMSGAEFHVMDGLVVSVILTVAVLSITTMIPNTPVEHHEH